MKKSFVTLSTMFLATILINTPAQADHKGKIFADRMFAFANQELVVGDRLYSSNQEFYLEMQGDCNLVLHRRSGQVLWASYSHGKGSNCRMAMQKDGNLVIYNEGGRPVYSSSTQGNWDAVLVLQNDGNLVIYRNHGATVPANWATGPH